MKRKKRLDLSKDPELYIDGEKVKFHTSRKDYRGYMQSKIRTADSFFSKQKRYLHFLLVDMVLIVIVGIVFSVTVGRATSVDSDGFHYYFSKKYFNSSPNLNFNIEVKNLDKETKILENLEMLFVVINEDEKEIFTKDIIITKQTYKSQEYFSKNIIVDRPPKGKYKAYINFGQDRSARLKISFTVFQ